MYEKKKKRKLVERYNQDLGLFAPSRVSDLTDNGTSLATKLYLTGVTFGAPGRQVCRCACPPVKRGGTKTTAH